MAENPLLSVLDQVITEWRNARIRATASCRAREELIRRHQAEYRDILDAELVVAALEDP